VVVLALYQPLFRSSFVVYDDPDYVPRNAYVLAGLRWRFTDEASLITNDEIP
jgi:hypothetical protein